MRFGDAGDVSAWLGQQPDLTVGFALTDHRPRRGEMLGIAVVDAAGRIVTAGADGGAAPRYADLILKSGRPLVGHEVEQLLVLELARRDPDATHNVFADARDLPPVALDTQIAAYILNAALRSQTLASISSERLEVELPPDGVLGGADHAALQAAAVAAVRTPMDDDLAKDEPLSRILHEVELPLIAVLATMESVASRSTARRWQACRRRSRRRSRGVEQEIYDDVGHQFTIGSPKQLEQVLFYQLNLPRGRRTKTGFSTDAAVLEDLRPAHPAIDKILEWRAYTKLRSTYVEALPLLLDPATGRAAHDLSPGDRVHGAAELD